jgi:hypothetical protein
MGFANQPGLISGRAQNVGVSEALQTNADAILATPIDRRHLPSHQASTIGLTDGRGDIELLETNASFCQGVDIGCLHNCIAIASQMVRSLLIGHEDDEIWLPCHVQTPNIGLRYSN